MGLPPYLGRRITRVLWHSSAKDGALLGHFLWLLEELLFFTSAAAKAGDVGVQGFVDGWVLDVENATSFLAGDWTRARRQLMLDARTVLDAVALQEGIHFDVRLTTKHSKGCSKIGSPVDDGICMHATRLPGAAKQRCSRGSKSSRASDISLGAPMRH